MHFGLSLDRESVRWLIVWYGSATFGASRLNRCRLWRRRTKETVKSCAQVSSLPNPNPDLLRVHPSLLAQNRHNRCHDSRAKLFVAYLPRIRCPPRTWRNSQGSNRWDSSFDFNLPLWSLNRLLRLSVRVRKWNRVSHQPSTSFSTDVFNLESLFLERQEPAAELVQLLNRHDDRVADLGFYRVQQSVGTLSFLPT